MRKMADMYKHAFKSQNWKALHAYLPTKGNQWSAKKARPKRKPAKQTNRKQPFKGSKQPRVARLKTAGPSASMTPVHKPQRTSGEREARNVASTQNPPGAERRTCHTEPAKGPAVARRDSRTEISVAAATVAVRTPPGQEDVELRCPKPPPKSNRRLNTLKLKRAKLKQIEDELLRNWGCH